MKNAGAKWTDGKIVTDKRIITSRSPDDLEEFVNRIVEEVEEGRRQKRAA